MNRYFFSRGFLLLRYATNCKSGSILLLVIFCSLLFLTGCAENMLSPKSITREDLSKTDGILIGSFSRDPDGLTYNTQIFWFKNVSTGKKYKIKSKPIYDLFAGKTPDDFKTKTSDGGVFIFSLPAGDYAFDSFGLIKVGPGIQSWVSKKPYSIPFSVHANKVNYVGEIKLIPQAGKNINGVMVPDGGIWMISDQEERDVAILKKKYPDMPLDDVLDIIPGNMDIFTALVSLPSKIKENNNRQKQELLGITDYQLNYQLDTH